MKNGGGTAQRRATKRLKNIINNAGEKDDLNYIDISRLESLSMVFYYNEFNGDISKWETDNIKEMYGTFEGSYFNGDISKWETGKVKDMSLMFSGSVFTGDISKWDVSNVRNMSKMFKYSQFKGDISGWDINPKCNMKNFGAHGIESYDDFLVYKEKVLKKKRVYKKVGHFADWLDI